MPPPGGFFTSKESNTIMNVTSISISDRLIESDETLSHDSFITIQGVTNTVQAFLIAGCIRQSGDFYTLAESNDPAILSVSNIVA